MSVSTASRALNTMTKEYLYGNLVLLNQDQALRFLSEVGIDRTRHSEWQIHSDPYRIVFSKL